MHYSRKKIWNRVWDQRGAGALVATASIAGLITLTGAIYVAGRVMQSSRVLESEAVARATIEAMIARASQAVAGNAVNCAKATGRCSWNGNFDPTEFGFTGTSQDGAKLVIRGDVCMSPDSMVGNNCVKYPMSASLSIANIQTLMAQGLVVGQREPGDYDSWGVLVESSAAYVTQSQTTDSGDGVTSRGPLEDLKGAVDTITRSVVIRRPRAFLRIESDPGFCSAGCRPPMGNNPAPPCYSPPQFTGDASQRGVVNVRVKNDGPGFVYAFKVRREFEPDPFFNTPVASLSPQYGQVQTLSSGSQGVVQLYDSVAEGMMGLAPGEEFSFSDTLPCFTEVKTETIQLNWGQSSGPPNSISASAQKTGRVVYSFEPATLDPDNMLMLSRSGTTIPAALNTNYNYLEPIPPDPPPDNGGDGGGGGGGDGDGCDGGGGCDGA